MTSLRCAIRIGIGGEHHLACFMHRRFVGPSFSLAFSQSNAQPEQFAPEIFGVLKSSIFLAYRGRLPLRIRTGSP